jgi:hypothetical protein
MREATNPPAPLVQASFSELVQLGRDGDDDSHKTADGTKTIAASDCNSCHLILAQSNGEQLKKLNADGYPFFHIGSEFSEFSCTTCHTGGPQVP